MRIGIITHWMATDNYGGILQTYALQRYLRDIGHDAYVIRFSRSPKSRFIIRVKRIVYNLFHISEFLSQQKENHQVTKWASIRNFKKFADEHIRFSSSHYLSYNELAQNPPLADAYITGSDQVWCFDLNNKENLPFFLAFGPRDVVRLSYAASFGHDSFPCKDITKFKKIISCYNGVSLREESGLSICNELGIESVRCVDSTLLLNKEQYISLVHKKVSQSPYLYLYSVNVSSPDEIYWDEIKKNVDIRHWKCLVTTGSGYIPARELFDGATYDYSSVEDWLSNIYYSDVVVTASFHGVVFSIIFEKDFVYIPLKSKLSSGNSRIKDLLSIYGLEYRIANSSNDVSKLLSQSIDYSNINTDRFIHLIEQSKSFLNEYLK